MVKIRKEVRQEKDINRPIFYKYDVYSVVVDGGVVLRSYSMLVAEDCCRMWKFIKSENRRPTIVYHNEQEAF